MRVCVVTPVYNDWECAEILIQELSESFNGPIESSIHIVDDGSTDFSLHEIDTPKDFQVEVLRLATNVGHQRAIAVGLVDVLANHNPDFIVVIDADGEDDSAHISQLLAHCQDHPDVVVVAQRGRRFATRRFIWFYAAYKRLFRIATSQRLDFGNFVVMSGSVTERLIAMPELWNHFPATIMKSKVSIERIPLDRRSRFIGQSRMNFVGLINHGLAGLAVFSDTVFARLLIFVTFLATILGLTIACGIALRLSTSVPIPGWIALTILFAAIGLTQLVSALLIIGFLILSSRNSYSPAPNAFAESLVKQRISLQPRTLPANTAPDRP